MSLRKPKPPRQGIAIIYIPTGELLTYDFKSFNRTGYFSLSIWESCFVIPEYLFKLFKKRRKEKETLIFEDKADAQTFIRDYVIAICKNKHQTSDLRNTSRSEFEYIPIEY